MFPDYSGLDLALLLAVDPDEVEHLEELIAREDALLDAFQEGRSTLPVRAERR